MELPEGAVVVIGDGEHARKLGKELRARVVAPAEVVEIQAGDRVKGVRTQSDLLKCSFAALAPLPAPAHELAGMLNQRVRFDGAGFAVDRDAQGYCGRFGKSEVWASGDVCGYLGPKAAHADGHRVAGEIIRRIQLSERERHG
jgi:hypothetical protein